MGALGPGVLAAARPSGGRSVGTMWPLSREQPGQAGRPQHGAQGRAACPRGGLAPGPGPAPGVLLGLAAEWPDALVASSLPLGRPPPRWWVWGSGPPASATSAILPAPMSIFQKFPVGGAEPQRPPLAPPSPGSQCQMRAGDKSSIFLVLLGWQQGLPSATWLLAALPPGAGVAEAQAAPARTQGPAAGGGQRSGARGPVGRGLAPGDGLLASGTCPPLLAPVTSRARDPVFTALLLRSSPSSCARGKSPSSRLSCWRRAGGSAILCSCLLRVLPSNWFPEIQNSISDPPPPQLP